MLWIYQAQSNDVRWLQERNVHIWDKWEINEDGDWIDENTGKEKRSNVIYLVQSSSLNAVCKSIDEIMDGSFFDYESMSVQETKILDVFKH